jgi:HSP20 family molecular chaperone IbpA
MSRIPLLTSPLLLGFDDLERIVERAAKLGPEGYPPYNIERVSGAATELSAQRLMLRITLAVAGFMLDQLDISVEDRQLVVRGKQPDDKHRVYLHRGIAARQFARSFVLAEGIEVVGANLEHGLLSIDLSRREPERHVQRIMIGRGQVKS